ncbi:MAG: hypothetical protein ABEJ72_09885, partial [Candidatus Aenigmatarchaeota archaeon]
MAEVNEVRPEKYSEVVDSFNLPSIDQTAEWGELRVSGPWESVSRITIESGNSVIGAAQLLERGIPFDGNM